MIVRQHLPSAAAMATTIVAVVFASSSAAVASATTVRPSVSVAAFGSSGPRRTPISFPSGGVSRRRRPSPGAGTPIRGRAAAAAATWKRMESAVSAAAALGGRSSPEDRRSFRRANTGLPSAAVDASADSEGAAVDDLLRSNVTAVDERDSLDGSSDVVPSSSDAVSAPPPSPPSSSLRHETPTAIQIVKFAIPAIGVWLCGPLLSLIDTAAVGLLAGTSHQAALSPAVAVTDYAALLLAFLYAATTNLVAASSAAERNRSSSSSNGVEVGSDDDASPSSSTEALLSALQLSLYVGLGLGTTLYLSAPYLVRTLVGASTPLDPSVFGHAVRYVRVRCLGFPAAAVLGSAQAACLGLKDVQSPLLVLGAAAIVNLIGDGLFVGKLAPAWLRGAPGAAAATSISQIAAALGFLAWLKVKPRTSSSDRNDRFGRWKRVGGILGRFRGKVGKKAGKEISSKNNVESEMEAQKKRENLKNSPESKLSLQMDAPMTSKAGDDDNDEDEAVAIPSGGTKSGPSSDDAVELPYHYDVNDPPDEGSILLREEELAKKEDALHKKKRTAFSTLGYLSSRSFRKRDALRLPPARSAARYLPYVVPVTTTSLGRVGVFLAMAHVVSSTMGTVGMAAQQIIVAMFEALCPVADSLSLTAQSFVPAEIAARQSRDSSSPSSSLPDDNLRKITTEFLKAGAMFNSVMLGIVATIPFASRMFTSDAEVAAAVNQIVPYLAGVFGFHGWCIGFEGVLLGRRDLNFMGALYGVYFAVVPALMLAVKRSFVNGTRTPSLSALWQVFLGYNTVRMTLWVTRSLWLTTERSRKWREGRRNGNGK